MDDLVNFLRARLDEDELIARDASVEAWTKAEAPSIFVMSVNGLVAETSAFTDALHIARHDPARVLAEVDAKRQALAHYERIQQHTRNSDGGADYIFAEGAVRKQAEYMALAYADHPDYRDEWRP